jgi:hypothetical protein
MGFFYWGEANNPARQSADRPSRQSSGQTADVWSGRVRIDDYFRGSVASPRDIPHLFGHPDLVWVQGEWTESGWRRTRVERVRLNSLYATQRWTVSARLRRHSRSGARPERGDLPWVVTHEGRNWVLDGHHRVITSIARGESHIRAHVKYPQFAQDAVSGGAR